MSIIPDRKRSAESTHNFPLFICVITAEQTRKSGFVSSVPGERAPGSTTVSLFTPGAIKVCFGSSGPYIRTIPVRPDTFRPLQIVKYPRRIHPEIFGAPDKCRPRGRFIHKMHTILPRETQTPPTYKSVSDWKIKKAPSGKLHDSMEIRGTRDFSNGSRQSEW